MFIPPNRFFLPIILTIAFLTQCAIPVPVLAQGADSAVDTPAPQVAPEMASPRAVLTTFLRLMTEDKKKEAAELLDLSALNAEAATAKGPTLAFALYTVMDRLKNPYPPQSTWPPTDPSALELVPDDPATPSPWKITELVRFSGDQAEQIQLSRDTQQRWRFSADTVQIIEELYAETESIVEETSTVESPRTADVKTTEPFPVRLRNFFWPTLRTKYVLLPTYQWICLLVVGFAGWLVDRAICRWGLTHVVDALLKHNDPDFDGSTQKVMRQVGRLAQVGIWYWGTDLIGLPLEVVNVVLIVLRIVTIVAAVLAMFAVVDLVAGYFSRRAKRTQRRFDDLLIPIAKSTIKFAFLLIAILSSIAAFNAELPAVLLGGLGIGGAAIALASQETLSNYIGSIAVLIDRPFEVGDWIITDGVEGEIESVGFRSTRIRTGPNSQVTIPNNKLSSAAIDNLGRRKYRRLLTTIGLEYGTSPELIEAFCEGVRELIRRHPHTRKDYYCCYFNNFGPSSLDILLVVYFEAPDWATELRERHRLLADIVRLAGNLGVEFAFPTQTLHLHRGEKTVPPGQPENPDRMGQHFAAQIAGELPNYQDRPGRVKFPGPTPID